MIDGERGAAGSVNVVRGTGAHHHGSSAGQGCASGCNIKCRGVASSQQVDGAVVGDGSGDNCLSVVQNVVRAFVGYIRQVRILACSIIDDAVAARGECSTCDTHTIFQQHRGSVSAGVAAHRLDGSRVGDRSSVQNQSAAVGGFKNSGRGVGDSPVGLEGERCGAYRWTDVGVDGAVVDEDEFAVAEIAHA